MEPPGALTRGRVLGSNGAGAGGRRQTGAFFAPGGFMSRLFVPENYSSVLSLYETQTAVGGIKRVFEERLSRALNLKRVSAPLLVDPETGLNDDLNGVERPVEFDVPAAGANAQIVQSLAKWKRVALHRYGFPPGEGLYADMNAVRRDDDMDNLHSVYVDQWDWEKVIGRGERNEETLKDAVRAIVGAICDTADALNETFPALNTRLSREVAFVTSQRLEDEHPGLSPKEREDRFLRRHGTAFVMKIGGRLRSGERHGGRAPDYDDWELNGDIMFWSGLLGCAIEISSMGIRVDEKSLDSQLSAAGCDSRRKLPYHKALLKGKLPLTIGGGIGQSRLCMLLLQKAHIGEVQVSVWDGDTAAGCGAAGIMLL